MFTIFILQPRHQVLSKKLQVPVIYPCSILPGNYHSHKQTSKRIKQSYFLGRNRTSHPTNFNSFKCSYAAQHAKAFLSHRSYHPPARSFTSHLRAGHFSPQRRRPLKRRSIKERSSRSRSLTQYRLETYWCRRRRFHSAPVPPGIRVDFGGCAGLGIQVAQVAEGLKEVMLSLLAENSPEPCLRGQGGAVIVVVEDGRGAETLIQGPRAHTSEEGGVDGAEWEGAADRFGSSCCNLRQWCWVDGDALRECWELALGNMVLSCKDSSDFVNGRPWGYTSEEAAGIQGKDGGHS